MMRSLRCLRTALAATLLPVMVLSGVVPVSAGEPLRVPVEQIASVSSVEQGGPARHDPARTEKPATKTKTKTQALAKPAVRFTPLHAISAPAHKPGPFATSTSLENLLRAIPLGASMTRLHVIAGDPWFVAREAGYYYFVFEIDNGHAWLVVSANAKGRIEGAQVSARADTSTSDLHDGYGAVIGALPKKAHLAPNALMISKDRGQPRSVANHGAARRFYGVDRAGNIDRIGVSIGDATMPLIVRWFRYDGEGVWRAIPFEKFANIGEDEYVRTVPNQYTPCLGGNSWHIIGKRQYTFGGETIDEAHVQCGNLTLKHTLYFNRTVEPVHGFDGDPMSQRALLGRASSQSMRDAVAAGLIQPAGMRPKVGSTTGQIWFTTPNYRHCTYNSNSCDVFLAYIDDPLNPLSSVTLTPSISPYTLASPYHHARSKKSVGTWPGWSCGASGGISKCSDPWPGPGAPANNGGGGFGPNNVPAGGGPQTQQQSGNPGTDQPTCPTCDNGANGTTGSPINVISGALWYQQQDFQLSGPDPMNFFHRYNSLFAQAGPPQTPPTDMGIGWRHAYDAYIDLTNASIGLVTLHRNDTGVENFQVGASGTSSTSYDAVSGDQLTQHTDGTFSLARWDGQTWNFDADGYITAITDRIGNTQTIARNSNHTIASVTDVLGRSLSFSYDTSNRITGVSSSPSGISLSFTYDSGTNCYTGQLCSATESDGKTWTYEYYDPSSYGGNSLLEYVIDPLGHTEEYNQYTDIDLGGGDHHYRLTQQQKDSGNESRTYSYSAYNYVGTTTITDSLGSSHTTTYTWDQLLQQVLSVSGPLCNCNGNTLQYTYDVVGRRVSQSEGSGTGQLAQTYTYGRDVTYTSPDGKTSFSIFAYPGATQVTNYGLKTASGATTSTTTTAYYALSDARKDLPYTVSVPSVDTPGNMATTTYTYSTTGLLTSLARQGYINGTSTTYTSSATYDSKGRVSTTTGPRTDVTQTTTYSYYPDTDTDLARRGQLETITDAASHTTNFATAPSPYDTYNIYGWPLSMTDQNGVVTEYTYDGRGRMLTSTLKGVTGDPTDRTTTYTYDGAGKLTSVERPLSNSTKYVYDSNDNLTNTIQVDSSGLQHDQIVRSFDTMNRLTGHTYQSCGTPASTCSTWSTQYSDTVGYTPLDQVQSVSYPTGGATNYTYDGAGNLATQSVGDSSYSVTNAYTYDVQHQNTQHTLGGSSLGFASDVQYNQAVVSPSNAVATGYQHDDFGRIEKATSPFTGVTTFSYDPAGNLTSKTDGNGATTNTNYDVLNRPLVATSTRSGYTTETVTRTYDDATSGHFGIGRLASITDPSGSTTYTYERHGLPVSTVQVANGTTYTTDYTYDGNANRQTVTLPSTRVLTYTYDYADRPLSVADGSTTYVSSATYKPFGPLATINYGNSTSQTRSFTQRYLPSEFKLTHGSTTLSDVTYTENNAGFITAATDELNSAYNQTFSYGGRATNMLTRANTGSALWGQAQYADTYNQNISSISLPGDSYGLTYNRAGLLTTLYNTSSGTSQSVTYDGAGNELTVGSNSYTYSARNHLASGDGVTYTYDGYGRRVSATASAGTRTSLYDLDMHLQSETSLSSGSIAYDYVWFAGLPVAQVDIGGNPHWTVTDYRGAPFMQTTSSGTVYWQADYAPFGAVYSLRTADVHQPLRLPGQEAEEFTTSSPNGDTGRFYNGFRWYRPLIGRYTQPDPLEYAGTNFSLYAYAQNNPVNYLDPLGLEACGNSFDWGAAAPWLLGAGLLALDIATGGAALIPELGIAAAAEAGAAEGAAAVAGEAEAASIAGAEESTTLYRAVSQGEFEDIQASGLLRPGGNSSYEFGKWFANTGEDAQSFGNALYPNGDFNVIQADFPSSVIEPYAKIDIAPGSFVQTPNLSAATNISRWIGSAQ